MLPLGMSTAELSRKVGEEMTTGTDANDVFTETARRTRVSYEEGPSWGTKSQLMPDPGRVIELLIDIRSILFPGYFDTAQGGGACGDQFCLVERFGVIHWHLARQIHHTLGNSCAADCGSACPVMQESRQLAEDFIEQLPDVRAALLLDVEAAYVGDPAAKDHGEILLSYPGVLAVTVHRIAHILFKQGLTLMARIMSEHAHGATGIDIHPGATIGQSFFIDHGTGVVIGETTIIGDRVKLYQGVTLGALSFPKDGDGNLVRNAKRHPTIEDDVTIYSGATVLGGDTTVGSGSVIGGNVWLTESVPPMSKVLNKPAIDMQRRRGR